MTTPLSSVFDAITGENLVVELTEDEIKNREIDYLARKTAEEKAKALEAENAIKRAELLTKLGITEDEAKLLLG